MKKNFAIILAIISLLADIITLTSALKCVLNNWFGVDEDKATSINTIVLFTATLCLLIALILLYCFMNEKRKDAGTHKIPCSWVYYWRYKVKNNNNTLLDNLHQEIYHNHIHLVEKIRKTKDERARNGQSSHLTINDFNDDIEILLKSFRDIFIKCFKLDLTINIYIAAEENSNTTIKRSVVLKSSKEGRRALQRIQDYKYVIKSLVKKTIENYTLQAKVDNNNNTDDNNHINSIFNYIMTSNESSWMSNDLKIDENKNNFFSSSEYYKNGNYKSLAVFAIIPPSKSKTTRERRGLLTFDSAKTEVFSEEECNMLMGLMAHLIFEVLKELE